MQITRPDQALKNQFLRRALRERALADVEIDSAGLNSSSSIGLAGAGAGTGTNAAFGAREMPIRRALPQHEYLQQTAHNGTTSDYRNTTSSALAAARELVKKARAEAAERNAARVTKPLRNKYLYGRRGSSSNGRRRGESAPLDTTAAPPSLLVITDEIAAAAALVAEADVKPNANVTRRSAAASKGSFWMQDIARKGTVPWGDDPNYVSTANTPERESMLG